MLAHVKRENRMKKILIFVFIMILSSILWADQYKRIISLAPSITQSFYELGVLRI